MLISKHMDLVQLANLIGPGTSQVAAKYVRDRLVQAWDGRDTSEVGSSDWRRVLKSEQVDPCKTVEKMLKNSGAQWLHYNRKTGEFSHGFVGPLRTGDRSIDASWVGFEVVTPSTAEAERLVRAYVSHPNAKYSGMLVRIVNGIAFNGSYQVDLS